MYIAVLWDCDCTKGEEQPENGINSEHHNLHLFCPRCWEWPSLGHSSNTTAGDKCGWCRAIAPSATWHHLMAQGLWPHEGKLRYMDITALESEQRQHISLNLGVYVGSWTGPSLIAALNPGWTMQRLPSTKLLVQICSFLLSLLQNTNM